MGLAHNALLQSAVPQGAALFCIEVLGFGASVVHAL